ncbi:MAG: L,D-transpeptidase [Methyloceanibacter sp.]|nr:L,D-transpeptidase [Methyloceanibacter sp.]
MTLSRRTFTAGALATGLVAASTPVRAQASRYFAGRTEDNGFVYRNTNFKSIDETWHRQVVKYYSDEPIGTVVVDTRHHFLYMIYENQTALRYGVGVGREGFQWFGRARIDRRALWPRWVPPPEMRQRQPELPALVEGGAADNPLGPRALYLYRDGVDTGYRLHGTLEPWSIGRNVSSGCIRMFPEDIIDLYQRAPNGTAVLVLEHIAKPT